MAVSSEKFELRGFTLFPWQQEAVRCWVDGDGAPHRGTFEVFTGGGKSLIAIACAAEAAQISVDFRLVVVVPTVALAEQWIETLKNHTNVAPSQIRRVSRAAMLGDLGLLRVAVVVINTASKIRDRLRLSDDTMLLVDECHRAGAPTFKSVLEIDARFRLGLSATPERDEVDAHGEPLKFDEQIVAQRLGKVVFSFNLGDARRAGWLPEYKVVHHGLSLDPAERVEYDRRSRRVDDLTDQLRELGVNPGRARNLQSTKGDLGDAARAYLAAAASRKDLLYRARERVRVAQKIISKVLSSENSRTIVFNERIDGANELYAQLAQDFPTVQIAIEHSQLSQVQRRNALTGFRDGSVRVLVSAKSLIEGIDVPAANIGISVASTGSVRQRIQALGRVLRRDLQEGSLAKKIAEMHLLYVADTVDETIYEKEDWSDLTGESLNEYKRWSLDANREPADQAGPPRRPRPTEDQEYLRLAALDFAYPVSWSGAVRGQEYRIDSRDNISNAFGTLITNPQDVGSLMMRARGVRGGKFIVTPRYRFILTATNVGGETVWYAAGRLHEPFETLDLSTIPALAGTAESFEAGSPFAGPLNAANGTYRIRSRKGGMIERRRSHGLSQFAMSASNIDDACVENAASLLRAWKTTIAQGIEFFINDQWNAWYKDAGQPRFLAAVPQGFRWPKEG